MDNPEIEIAVLADGEQWSGSHDSEKYLVSERVLEELQNGLKPYNIERDFIQGIDWIKVEDNATCEKCNLMREKLADNYRAFGDC
jgi:hypothetical protein